jgi:hypothetical protein
MRQATTAIVVLGGVLLAACVTQFPQTAEEFRQTAPGTTFIKTETFEVARNVNDVGQTFKRRAPECLNISVRTTSRTNTSYQVIVAEYKPTVVVTPKRAELHVQRHYAKGVINVGQEPAGGHYLLVADAYPAGSGRTRVQVIMPSIGHAVLLEAIKGWASGKNLGCPDMTKI